MLSTGRRGGTSSWETVGWTGIRKKGGIRTLNFERARRNTHSPLPTTHTICGKQFEVRVVLGNKKRFDVSHCFLQKILENGSNFSVSNSPVSHTFMLAVYIIFFRLEKNKYIAEQASIPFSSRIREIRDFFPSFTKHPPLPPVAITLNKQPSPKPPTGEGDVDEAPPPPMLTASEIASGDSHSTSLTQNKTECTFSPL